MKKRRARKKPRNIQVDIDRFDDHGQPHATNPATRVQFPTHQEPPLSQFFGGILVTSEYSFPVGELKLGLIFLTLPFTRPMIAGLQTKSLYISSTILLSQGENISDLYCNCQYFVLLVSDANKTSVMKSRYSGVEI